MTKTPDPAVVNEPGGTVTYTVHVTNTSSVDSVTLTAAGFEDKVKKNGAADTGDITAIGDLSCEGGFPVHLAPGAGVNCTFSLPVSGVPTDKINDRITVTGTDDDGQPVSDYAEATVTIVDVPSSIEVTKTADPVTLDENLVGKPVTYTVTVKNTSPTDSVTVDSDGFVDKVKVNGDPATGDVVAIDNLDCDLEDDESNGLRLRSLLATRSRARSR